MRMRAIESSRLRIGVVGCGEVTRRRHLPALRLVRGAEVVALADRDPAALAAARAMVPGARLAADAEELAADPTLHAVLVATPPAQHEEVVVAMLAAGCHVLCEKPLALEVSSCDRIAAVASSANRMVTVAFNLRHHPAVQAVRREVTRGALGRPELVQSRSTSSGRDEAGSWSADPKLGGGVLFEQAVHHVDLWHFVLADRIAESSLHASGTELATISAVTERGTLISGAFSWRTGPENRIAVFGRRGRASADMYAADPAVVWPSGLTGSEPRARLASSARTLKSLARVAMSLRAGGAFDATYAAQWRSFLAATVDGATNPCPPSAGASATAVLRSLLDSPEAEEPAAVRS